MPLIPTNPIITLSSKDKKKIKKKEEKYIQQVKDALADPTIPMFLKTPEPSLLEQLIQLKSMGLQIVMKYMATKKRWNDPKRQNEADYILCKTFLEMCKK
jgi:hypothetical protein